MMNGIDPQLRNEMTIDSDSVMPLWPEDYMYMPIVTKDHLCVQSAMTCHQGYCYASLHHSNINVLTLFTTLPSFISVHI